MPNKIYSYTTLDNNTLAHELDSDLDQGLSVAIAQARLTADGQNEVDSEQLHWWQILFRQLKSPFVYLLILAAGLAYFLGAPLDAGMILFFILINSSLGFYQEFKSDQAFKLLRQYTRSMAKVIRGGEQIIVPAGELVRGDVVVLETGDFVPADIRLFTDTDLIIDETILTGESTTVHKNGLALGGQPEDIYGAVNIVFRGTTVVGGASKGIVVAVGQDTAFGQIKKLTTETARESIFYKGIANFSRFILKLTVVTLVFVFLANVAIKGSSVNIPELLIFLIALAVAVIPEALPLVTTISLSRGAMRLAKNNTVVKRLSSVEDLGSIEVLCTDKTGTITENKLAVYEMLPLDGRDDLLLHMHLAGSFFRHSREPFDLAIEQKFGVKNPATIFHQLATCPFDPKRRRNSVLVQNEAGERMLIVRGAPEDIMALSANIDAKEKKIFSEWLNNEEQRGHRSLAVATKTIDATFAAGDIAALETELNFEGCISFVDPIKQSAFSAIKKAEQLGVIIKIITGDSAAVAFNVAREVGLAVDMEQVMVATDFMNLSKAEQLKRLRLLVVFARTTPEQKHYLVKLLQENYEVGFLGEGINDSPALKAAGVSIVVQSASDIARETADIILLKKDLSVIIDGIEEGRIIFSNTIKYVRATLASNFGNFYALAIGSLFINFLPMLPLQLLLVNLLSDFPMLTISVDTVDKTETSLPQKYNVREVVFIATILGLVSTAFDFMFFALFYRLEPAVLQTNWFIGSILTELVFLFSIRTRLPFYKAKAPAPTVIGLTAIAFVTTIILPFTAFGQEVFHFIRPSFAHLTLILILVGTYFVCSEIVKNIYYRSTIAKNGI